MPTCDFPPLPQKAPPAPPLPTPQEVPPELSCPHFVLHTLLGRCTIDTLVMPASLSNPDLSCSPELCTVVTS